MTNAWRLIITKKWREYTFRFETLVEAGEFVNTFSRHIEPDEDEDDAKYPWRYCIEPIMEEEDNAEV